MKITFLCGCTTGNIEDLENLRTMDAVGVDADGMLVCAIHNMRRYGWRSTGMHHELDRLTPFELENFTVFHMLPTRPPIEISPAVRESRDNRDPESVWFKMGMARPPQDAKLRASEVTDREITDNMKRAVRSRLDLKDRTGWPVLGAKR